MGFRECFVLVNEVIFCKGLATEVLWERFGLGLGNNLFLLVINLVKDLEFVLYVFGLTEGIFLFDLGVEGSLASLGDPEVVVGTESVHSDLLEG